MELNKIYCMDNLELLRQLPDESISLIYCDILYNTGRKFKDYDDKLGTPQQAMKWYKPRLIEMKRVLKDTGSIYLQCDWHLNSYLRILMDNIFGINNFKRDIIWKKTTKTTNIKNYGSEYDNILFYTKGAKYTFNQQYKEIKESELRTKYIYLEKENGSIMRLNKKQKHGIEDIPKGRIFRAVPLTNMNPNRPNLKYEFLGYNRVWSVKKEVMKKLQEDGLIFQINGGLPYKKGYLDENKGAKINDVWVDINPINSQASERAGYDTQKPKELLERIIKTSSNEGNVVADFFCGSGTSMVVAKELGRQYIGCDINPRAVEITNERLNN